MGVATVNVANHLYVRSEPHR